MENLSCQYWYLKINCLETSPVESGNVESSWCLWLPWTKKSRGHKYSGNNK